MDARIGVLGTAMMRMASMHDDEVAELQARIDVLEAALKPFCEAFGEMAEEVPDDARVFITSPEVFQEMTVHDFRQAARVLKPDWYREGGE